MLLCLTKYDATSSASLAPVTPAKHQAAHYSGGKLLYCTVCQTFSRPFCLLRQENIKCTTCFQEIQRRKYQKHKEMFNKQMKAIYCIVVFLQMFLHKNTNK